MKDGYGGAKAYQVDGKPVTPFNSGLKQYDDYVGEVRKSNKTWRMVAYISLATSCLSVLGWLYVGSLPKTIPYVIEVAPWGESRAVGTVGEGNTTIEIPQQAKIYYMRKAVEQIRSIPLDKTVMLQNLNDAYELFSAKAAAVVTAQINSENYYKLFGSIRREVKVQSIINITGAAWQIDWLETDYSPSDARALSEKRMRAIVTVAQGEPGLSINSANPLGIIIDTYQQQIVEGQ